VVRAVVRVPRWIFTKCPPYHFEEFGRIVLDDVDGSRVSRRKSLTQRTLDPFLGSRFKTSISKREVIMSNWEPEEVADADLEGIAGGAGKGTPKKDPMKKGDSMSGGDAKSPTKDEEKGMGKTKGFTAK
jgi:hypothetical protein